MSINNGQPTRDRIDSLSTDVYEQLTKRLELYGRFSLRFTGNGQADLPFVSNLSYLAQARAQYQITERIDWAFETRALFQPSSHTMRSTYATEIGFWVVPDLRLGGGYNFTAVSEPERARIAYAAWLLLHDQHEAFQSLQFIRDFKTRVGG